MLTAQIMRKLDDLNWLGTSLTVLGTNALYAYEAKAAVKVVSLSDLSKVKAGIIREPCRNLRN